MLAEFTGGWRALAISAALLSAIGHLVSAPLQPIMLGAAAALLAARAMRAALPAVLPVLALASAGVGTTLLTSGSAFPTPDSVARELLGGCFDIALATLILIARPRRLIWQPPLPRWRIADVLFIGSAAGFAAAIAAPGWWSVAGILAVLAYVAGIGCAATRVTNRLRQVLREGRVRAVRRRSGRLPREIAFLFLAARRITDGLHRRAALQDLHLESARLRAGRLQQQQRSFEQEKRSMDLELQRSARTAEDVETRWRAFLDAVPEGLIVADANGRIEYANQGIRRLLGYEPGKLIGASITALIPAAQTGDPLDLGALSAGGSPPAVPVERNVRFTGARGALHEFSTRVQVFVLAKGLRIAIRLREASGPLQRDQFVAKLSHEIRTPLHGLMATLDMLRSERLTSEGGRRLSIARTSAKSLMRIANDILDLTRASAGGMTIERRAMSIDRLISDVVDEARARDEALPLHIRSEIIGALPPAVLGDPVRIKQILRNLLSNSLKFTPTGSVSVSVSWMAGQCSIEVVDTGSGIPEDRRESIFEAFVQADNSRRKGGAGLGLAISRQLSEAMGGSLTLRQSSPRGSRFRLVLPLAATDETPLDDQSQRNLPAVRSRILVAEDDEASRYVAQALLDALQCPARVAADGIEALEILRKEEFDLILLDCDMPGLDGYEVTARIRQRGGPHIPIIAMTASTMAADRQRCFDAGMDDLLAKPFSRGALSEMLAKWLAPHSANSAPLTFAQELSMRPELDSEVFEELRGSLNWQIPPLRKIYLSIPVSAQKAIAALGKEVPADLELAQRLLHSLQGGAGLVGARQIEFLAARLLQGLKDERRQDFGERLALLPDALRRFEKVVNQRLDALSAR